MKKYPCKCSVTNCKRKVFKSEHSDKCSRHRNKHWRENHPLTYAFKNLRVRAGQRGIRFTLTFEQYEAFAIKTDYAKMKGHSSLSLTIDRIDSGLGYHWWNIQTLTLQENSRKQFVPYFSGGKMPQFMLQEYRQFEKEFHDQCETVAEAVGAIHGFGTPAFWKEYKQRKDTMFEKVEETL